MKNKKFITLISIMIGMIGILITLYAVYTDAVYTDGSNNKLNNQIQSQINLIMSTPDSTSIDFIDNCFIYQEYYNDSTKLFVQYLKTEIDSGESINGFSVNYDYTLYYNWSFLIINGKESSKFTTYSLIVPDDILIIIQDKALNKMEIFSKMRDNPTTNHDVKKMKISLPR